MTKKTAGEFVAELEAEPEWVARQAARDRVRAERVALFAEDERELVMEIRSLGYDIDSVYDLVNSIPHPILKRRFIGAYSKAYPTLIRHLSLPHLDRIREGIVRALTVRNGGAELEAVLLDAFKSETLPQMRWVLANALRTAMPYHRRKKHPAIAATLQLSSPVKIAPPSNTR